jgi:ATP-binding cassette, subfamily B, bacterial
MRRPTSRPRPANQYRRLFVRYLRPQRGRVGLLAALILAGIALQLITPQLVRRFLDAVEQQRTLQELVVTALIFIALSLLAQAAQLAATYVGEFVAWTATNNLRADLALHCLRLDLSFHKQYRPGELIERVDGDVNKLATFFSQLIIELLSNALLIAGVIVLLWLVDWRIGAAATLIALLGLQALNWFNRLVVPRWQALRQANADLFGYLEEWLNSTEDIQAAGASAFIMRRLYRLSRSRWRRMQAAMRFNMGVMGVPVVVPALAYMIAYWWGTALFQGGLLTVGTVYLVFYYLDTVRGPLWVIQRQVQDLQQAAASINRIAELLALSPAIADGLVRELPHGPLAVRFANVSFHYEDDRSAQILSEVDFTLAPGRVLGLLGRTGSGKTTLIRLLLRFHDPTTGAIGLGRNDDGVQFLDLPQTTLEAIRSRIALVTQDVELFHASVRDNLTLFDNRVSDDQILAALDVLGLRPWLNQLPRGLDTHLDAGQGLSAGEAQLLALGRVFLADPGLVILDEASSRLDPATEKLLEAALDRLLLGRTAIIIAHRLATVRRADEIMILEHGRVVEHGPRSRLAEDENSRFAQLLQTGLETAA